MDRILAAAVLAVSIIVGCLNITRAINRHATVYLCAEAIKVGASPPECLPPTNERTTRG